MSQTAVASLERAAMSENSHASKTRIVILGGGFGGVYTARHLEKLCQGRQDVEIILVSRDNFLLMTPLLFEVCSGTLDLRHCSFPVRAFLRTTRFVEATVQGVDLERRVVHLAAPGPNRKVAASAGDLPVARTTSGTPRRRKRPRSSLARPPSSSS